MILRAMAKLIMQSVVNHRILGVETPRKTTSVPSTHDTAVQNVTHVDFRTFTDISLLPFLNRTNTSGLRPRISVSATSHRHGAPKGLDVTVSVRRLGWQRWWLREFQNLSRNDLELCSRGEFMAGGHARNAPSYQLRGPERRNRDDSNEFISCGRFTMLPPVDLRHASSLETSDT